MGKTELKLEPKVVLENGKPSAVILNIDEYEEILERLEDQYFLKKLAEIRKQGESYRDFNEFMAEYNAEIQHQD